MEKAKFFSELKDVLELNDDLNQKSIISLSSLHILAVIAFVDENFDMQLNTSEIKHIDSVEKLMEKIGFEKFN